MSNQQQKSVMRLTALWALSESGLGGIMHAFKIPFTGFFLGGFAIVIITLLAGITTQKTKTILQATLLVVLVKAAASPHSPPMAYIAVGFQGLIGAVIYGLSPSLKFAAPWFGALALFESAIQKFLVMTLIFGKSVWEALDLFVNGILKDFHINSNFSFSYWVMGTYTLIYVLWGFIVGWWASGLWKRLHASQTQIIEQYQALPLVSTQEANTTKKKRTTKIWSAIFVLLFISSVFLFNNLGGKAGYAILRTIAALLLIWFVLNPILTWIIQRWLTKKKESEQQQLATILALIPELKILVQPAFQLAKSQKSGIGKYRAFVFNLLVLTLFANDQTR